ncbi:DUF2867 domain-containing protein [Oleomonas cavernae]|uniref:DUF2867 domain-containing protein n=1 Tax=Oleomonas cavernae TaxID=2320859 RepID=A0A418WCV5_9PROT|nr:DUF2867 domain-containing protein [Oleomonas cavernae]RJF87855.1 DUF2867 domain-containing protein [Oleomonas cavernae]
MRIQSVPPESSLRPLLPGASFADAFTAVIGGHDLDAGTAAARVMGRSPGWIRWLMALRNGIVAPLGLKTGGDARGPKVGFFPVLSQAADQVVLGLDDRHLDFRVAVVVAGLGPGRQRVTVTTLVRPHNLLGRIYLTAVLPFHRLIVPAMLAQAEKA